MRDIIVGEETDQKLELNQVPGSKQRIAIVSGTQGDQAK